MSNAEEKEKAKNRFIPNSIAIHGDLYDYSKVVYNGTDTKVIIICKIHGEFFKTPYNHIRNKQGCPICNKSRVRSRVLKNRKIIVRNYYESESKQCSKCKENKDKSEFHKNKNTLSGLTGQCKKCLSKPAKIKPPKMYEHYKFCFKCNRCKNVDEFNKNNSKPSGLASLCKDCEKVLRTTNISYIREYRKNYYEKNREIVIQKEAKYKGKLAKYRSYASKLTPQEVPTNVDGELFVKCKNCGKLFQPTNSAVRARIHCLNNFGTGESHLYCSGECKESCDIFKAISRRKSERGIDKVSRSCQAYIKRELQQLQCDNDGEMYCERCGDLLNYEIHHTNMVKDKKDVNNAAGMILLCSNCHRELHRECA